MTLIDHPGEWLRLSEHYRQMTDGELIKIAAEPEQLTEIAKQMLAMELSARKLTIGSVSPHVTKSALGGVSQPKHPRVVGLSDRNVRPTRDYAASEVDPYAKDRELVEILTVWSLRDALQVQCMLDLASIPFYMGDEKATSVEAVTSNFAAGVSVRVMRIGFPWTWQALQYYDPKDVPESEKWHWNEEVDVRCPSCRSKEITFEELLPSTDSAAQRYKWTCSHCGRKWEDDGVAKG